LLSYKDENNFKKYYRYFLILAKSEVLDILNPDFPYIYFNQFFICFKRRSKMKTQNLATAVVVTTPIMIFNAFRSDRSNILNKLNERHKLKWLNIIKNRIY